MVINIEKDFNFPLAVLKSIEAFGASAALEVQGSALSGRQLSSLIRSFATRLAAHGINPTHTVVIGLADGVQTYIAAMAASLLGTPWVIYEKALPQSALRNVRVISDGKLQVSGGMPALMVDRKWFTLGADALHEFAGFSSPADIFAIASSSGTTGTPKFMARTVGSLLFDLSMLDVDMIEGTAMAERFSAGSILGFELLTSAYMSRCRVLLPASPAGQATEFAHLLEQGVSKFVASPMQLTTLLGTTPPGNRRIRSLTAGGAIITRTMLATWLQYFERVHIVYGSRESAGHASVTLTEPRSTHDIALAVDPRGEVEIVASINGADETVPAGTSGVVRFRRPYMVTEYIGAPEVTAEVFRDGWFYPGDLGHLDSEGRLHITGRLHDQINIGGIKFNAAEVDALATTVPGVEAAMCFTAEQAGGIPALSVCLCIGADETPSAIATAVRSTISAKSRAPLSGIYLVDAIPVNENGKPMRSMGVALTSQLQPL